MLIRKFKLGKIKIIIVQKIVHKIFKCKIRIIKEF